MSLSSFSPASASAHNYRQKAYKRRIAQWQAFKNYKAAEKKAVVDYVTEDLEIHDAIPSAQLHGKPIQWDRIKRFSRLRGPKRVRRGADKAPIGRKIELDSHLHHVQPAISVNERILFLTKSYLDWNVSKWNPLGLAKSEQPSQGRRKLDLEGEEDLRIFNKCFYDAIPMLLTNRTFEAFQEINVACSLARQCLERSPYWIFLRLLRLYSYPLWDWFSDVRRQIVNFLQALASRTLPDGHPLKPLLELWAQDDIKNDKARLDSLLRLSSDTFGPSSGLDAEEWAWIQDEICSLTYRRSAFHDALRIASRLAENPDVPHGVHIASRHMIARYHLHHDNIQEAETILLETLTMCDELDTEDEKARFLQQSYSELGYVYHVKQEQTRSLVYHQQALRKAIQLGNTAHIYSLRCRMEILSTENRQQQDEGLKQIHTQQQDSSWALWAFCRPYS